MYRQRMIRAGKTLEIEKYVSYHVQSGNRVRGPKLSATTEEMRRVNERNSIRKLTWTMNENFGEGDLHLTLTYGGDAPEVDVAKKDLEKLLRKLRKIYKSAGVVLRYIAVTEYKTVRIHHHLLVSAINPQLIRGVWEKGRPKFTMLDNSGNYWRLASYFGKELRRSFEDGNGVRRWQQSRNLKHPEPENRTIKRKSFRKDPAPHIRHKGKTYYADASRPVERFVDEVTGYEHTIFFYRCFT